MGCNDLFIQSAKTGTATGIRFYPGSSQKMYLSSTGVLAINSLAAGGIVKADTSGNLGLAVAGSDYEPPISAGTTGQYWRGDKTWQTHDKASVGLGNVENTTLSTWTGSSNISNPLSIYAAGTAYTFDDTVQLIDFGTTDPNLTINQAGTYLLMGRVVIEFAIVTPIADYTQLTLKLRKTNNTPADVNNSQTNLEISNISFTGNAEMAVTLPPVFYTTTNTDDIIQLWGGLDTLDYIEGSLNATEASIVAIRLY